MGGTAGFKSASGYGNVSDTPLGTDKAFHHEILARAWPKDILSDIVNSRIVGDYFHCNQVVEFLIEPDVGPWRPYSDNQVIKPDTIQLESTQMRLCYQAYKAIKIDNALKRNLCKYWEIYEDRFIDACYRELSGTWQNFVLNSMVLEAHRENKGQNAGRHRDVNLGSVGNPVRITAANLPSKINDLAGVLAGQEYWHPNSMFLVIPPELRGVIINSEYRLAADISCCKEPSMLLSGELPGQLVGFRAIETKRTPGGFDTSINKMCYYVLAFWKEAFAFYGDIVEARLTAPTEYFGEQYQMLALWGGKAIYDRAIAVAYWTLD